MRFGALVLASFLGVFEVVPESRSNEHSVNYACMNKQFEAKTDIVGLRMLAVASSDTACFD